MSTTVSLPDGTTLEFPDGTDPAVIQRAVAQARMHVQAASAGPSFSDVTGGASSSAADSLAAKRAQMAQARQIAAAQGLAGPAPAQGVGDRLTALGDRFVSGAAEGLASMPELAQTAVAQFLPTGVTVAPDASPYPTIGKPGGFLDMRAQREDIRRQADAARERLLASEGDPGVIAAADTLALGAGSMLPLPGVKGDLEALAGRGVPRAAAPVAEAVADMTPEEAAYLARRAKALRSMPGPAEAPLRPGAIVEAMQPERSILQVGTNADNLSQDVALGLRARPQDAADAAELARVSQAIDEHAAPSLPRQEPPSLAEIFGDRQGSPQIGNAPPAPRVAVTERGTRIGFDYEVRDASDLVTSHDEALRPNPQYPRELQPRDRTRLASEAQVGRIEKNLNPDLLGESAHASNGAPIIGPDNVVESGNARSIALKRAYRMGGERAGNYRSWLAENAPRFGIDPAAVETVPHPVLVRVRNTAVDRAGFAVEANEAPQALMSATERAGVDAGHITPEMLDSLRIGENGVNLGTNPDFVRAFAAKINPAELGSMFDAQGQLSAEGAKRLQNAILSKAYGDPEAVAQLTESADNNVRAVGSALMQQAPRYARMGQAMGQGALHPLDITPDIGPALRKLSVLRSEGTKVPDYLAQGGLFGSELSPESRALLALFDANGRSSAKVSDILGRYADLVEGLGHPKQAGLFGSSSIPSRMDLLREAAARVENQPALFAMAERPPLTATVEAELSGRAVPTPRESIMPAGAETPLSRPAPEPPVRSTLEPVSASSLAGTPPPEPPPPALRNLLTNEELPLDTPYTGTKNAVAQSERIARGLPEVEDLARKSTGDTWHEARTLFEQDPEAPRILAQQVAEKPRALTPVENDLLLHDRMKMTLDHREALAAESAALDAGDADAAAMAKLRRTSIEVAMDTNDTALKRSGTEWHAGGMARQKLISEDYSPLYLRQRLTVASREAGVPPPPGAVEKLDQLSAQLTDAQKQLAAYESRVSELEAQRNVAAAQRETVRAQRAGVRQATRQQLDQEYEQLGALLDKKARARQSTAFMSGGLDPETVGIITKMARNRVQAGVTALPDLVQGIHETIVPHIPGLEPSEVRDAISGYGVVRNQATRSEAEAALARIRQQGRLVSKIEALQEGEALPAAAARAKPDDVTLALREKLRQTTRDLGLAKTKPEADRLAAIQKRLEQRIADAERGIGNTRAAKVKDTPQIRALRQQLQQTLEEHGLAPEGGGRQLTDEQRLAALKTRLAKREAELTDAIATGSIPKKVRRPLALDADAIALQGRVNNLKRQADLIIRKQELAGRGPLEKGLDWTAGWGRFLKLTGTNTLAKISAAAAERALVFKPIEEVLGAGWSKLPIVRDVAGRAPIEGGGSLDAIAKSYAGFFGKQAREEMGAYLRGGEGNLEAALGKPHLGGEAPAWMSYPGKVHAALKSPAKVAAYEYAMEKQAKFYLGKDNPEALLDPALQAEMKARAWEYAQRDIFMGDNAAVNAFRRAFAHQEGESLAARSGKTAANVLMPIVKVPTNYALEATDYLFGVPKGMGRLAFAVKKGISELPAEQADLIMRQLKKGSLGTAMIGLGAAGVVEGGGYWQAGEHRKESDLQPGEVRVAGVTIPHLFLHHPVVEALQVGASLRRARSIPAGLGNSARGLAEQVPFIETPIQMGGTLMGREPMKAVGEFERGMTIPPDAQRLARVLDQKKPRTPAEMAAQHLGLGGLGVGEHRIPEIEARKRTPHGGFWEQLLEQEMLGVPGLRDNVR